MTLPTNPSASFMRANPQLYAGKVAAKVAVAADKPIIRQKTKGPNKLEAEFERYLKETYPEEHVHSQALGLRIANGCVYWPDFIVKVGDDILAFETKGFMRDDAAVKAKVAARMFPWISFTIVTKRRKKDGGGWNINRVLP